MAELIASQIDASRFGVRACYLIGSAKNATAGPASDIDLLLHICSNERQKAELLEWLRDWSRRLDQQNQDRTGCRTDGILDIHLVTDDDVRARAGHAYRIDAVTDAALPLPMQGNNASAG